MELPEVVARPSRCRGLAREAAPAGCEHKAGAPARLRRYGSGGGAGRGVPGLPGDGRARGKERGIVGSFLPEWANKSLFVLTLVALDRSLKSVGSHLSFG